MLSKTAFNELASVGLFDPLTPFSKEVIYTFLYKKSRSRRSFMEEGQLEIFQNEMIPLRLQTVPLQLFEIGV